MHSFQSVMLSGAAALGVYFLPVLLRSKALCGIGSWHVAASRFARRSLLQAQMSEEARLQAYACELQQIIGRVQQVCKQVSAHLWMFMYFVELCERHAACTMVRTMFRACTGLFCSQLDRWMHSISRLSSFRRNCSNCSAANRGVGQLLAHH